MTGLICEKNFYLFDAPSGNNGKSLLLEIVKLYMWQYQDVIDSAIISEPPGRPNRNTGGPKSHMAALSGLRLGVVTEVSSDPIAEQQIRTITGDTFINARDLHQKSKDATFFNQCKVLGLCNELPTMTMTSYMVQRLRVLPAHAKFLDPKDNLSIETYSERDKTHFVQDKTLRERLTAEAAMCWAVQGAVAYFKDGMSKWPGCCEDAMKRFAESNDSLGDFIAAECKCDSGYSYPCKKFHENFISWTQASSMRHGLPKQAIIASMNKRGFRKIRSKKEEHRDKEVYMGIQIKAATFGFNHN